MTRRSSPWAVALVCAAGLGCLGEGPARLREGNRAAHDGRLEDARRAFEAAARALPDDPRPRELLGNVLSELGRAEDASAAWQQALALTPSSPGARLGLARQALEAKDAGAALSALGDDAAPPVEPHLAAERLALRSLALLARGAPGDAEAALRAADDALGQSPGQAEALYARGGALLALGRLSDAQAALEALSVKHPTSPLGPYGLARLAAAQARATDVLLHLAAARTTAGAAWRPQRVAQDPAFAFLSTSEGFLALVSK